MTNEFVTAVLFDWDFTLAYTLSQSTSYDKRTTIMFQRAGVACTLEDFQEARAAQQVDMKKGVVAVPAHPQEKADFFLLYRDILNRMGVTDVSDDLVYAIYSEYARLPTYLYDDVLPTLQLLHRSDVRIGILSNHTTAVRAMIEQLVGHYIPSARITISEEVGLHKPDPKIYQRAAQKIDTPPARCIYVGDNLNVDAIGAVEFGGFAAGVWIDRHQAWRGQEFPENVTRVTNLSQIVELYNFESESTPTN